MLRIFICPSIEWWHRPIDAAWRRQPPGRLFTKVLDAHRVLPVPLDFLRQADIGIGVDPDSVPEHRDHAGIEARIVNRPSTGADFRQSRSVQPISVCALSSGQVFDAHAPIVERRHPPHCRGRIENHKAGSVENMRS